ncbi:MAG: zinc ABC transporter substrate-binding protein [Acidimicrobiia bacterium]|nr:zinc ABC transporter substrate-binding protein [Acidimicrobiia bacterium]
MRSAVLPPLLALLALGGCGDDNDPSGGRPTVVTSFYPLTEAATRVGGERMEVVNLTPAGTEPHDLELTSDQVDAVLDADVVLYLGSGFQPAVEDAIEGRDGRSIDLLEAVPVERGAIDDLEGAERGGDAVDPHFWLDPTLLADATEVIREALRDLDPGGESTFEANAEAYRGEIMNLDRDLEASLGACRRRDLVTSHAAFHYLAERYGLRQEPIAGLSPEVEPDPDRLSRLTELIEREGVTTVFYEELVSPEVAETLAREADVDTAVLNPIEGLTDEQVDAGDTYASVMRNNLAALVRALGCG